MNSLALAAAILRLAGHPDATGASWVRARLLAVVIAEEANRAQVDAVIVAALIWKESGFNPGAMGANADFGLMQIRRGGAVPASLAHLSNIALMHPRINIRLGCTYLAKMVRACGGNVAHGLSRYNGGRCRDSRYAREILRAAANARREEVAAK